MNYISLPLLPASAPFLWWGRPSYLHALQLADQVKLKPRAALLMRAPELLLYSITSASCSAGVTVFVSLGRITMEHLPARSCSTSIAQQRQQPYRGTEWQPWTMRAT
jgi:hypothetical protein